MAGLAAAAVAFGNAPSVLAATTDETGHHSAAAPAAPENFAAPGNGVSVAQLVSLADPTATGPVVRLDATRMAAIKPKGKHHRTLPAKYVVKSGDTLASIAQHLYHSADYWTALYWANKSKVTSADDIQVGQVLTVPAKPAKAPSAPAEAAPSPAPAATTASTASYGASDSSASTPAPAPAQAASTGSGSSGSSSFQECVIAAESGGNPQAWNPAGYYGLYQFSAATWAAYGGNPADFGHASVAEQNQVFENAMAAGGASNWAPYDGC